ncbi:hypothetical protein OKW21_003178 [Catalinimonas alkaloidigena]|uniref:DUF5060 domain-containing protein n=1 Tax=Catalinimonas alkaloidigena TaxID=1075417 RepID=UPI0024058F3B|nr:DUF5060 domain-containing protein [Catalinimonas alkaloidigena]MDF9797915.1 hypothetical protein [Catalinimonas alkaloidigena]
MSKHIFLQKKAALLLLFLYAQSLLSAHSLVQEELVFEEVNGMLSAEAEHFYKQTHTGIRQWYLVSTEHKPTGHADPDEVHIAGASNNAYLEILPDTRTTHDDPLIHDENFVNEPGKMAVLYYKAYINEPGRYYVWVRTHSTGTEDNGLHVGIDGQWPEHGQRMQWTVKNQWYWDNKQRTQEVHTGVPMEIYLDIDQADEHEIMFSMREDGFEFDKWMLVKDKNYRPEQNMGPSVRLKSGNLPPAFPAPEQTELKYNKDKVSISGALKKWHKISLTFDGPETRELADENPFLHYRLDVTFTHDGKSYTVPGFYAADGNAAESSSDSGNKWRVRFTPDEVGEWSYSVSFKKGKNIAVAERSSDGESAGFMDGMKGKISVADTDKTGIDNRAKGRLKYVGEPYLRFEESGQYFIKVGVDAPENLFAYRDFDATTDVFDLCKTWQPHQKDFSEDAQEFLWQGQKGKNLLGAINYLASEGLNVFSFLTFNVDGDDRNVFPYLLKVPETEYVTYANEKANKNAWETLFNRTRFDVSKLEQWERILDYAERKGMFLHFKTHETETDHLMDEGRFGLEGKLYYRELIARFGHHLAMNWNLGEENNQPIEEVIKVANYIEQLDPYGHHMVIHTFPNQDERYASLIGDQSPLTGASLQLSDKDFRDVHERVLKWRAKSDSSGRQWALAVDEPGNAKFALLPDDEDPEHELARSNALWGTLMAGSYGVEWYFGYNSPNSDLTCEDFRSRDDFWDQNRYAYQFFNEHIPFWEMEPSDALTTDNASYCLAKKDDTYVVYLPPGTPKTSLNLKDNSDTFSVLWYDPFRGGKLQQGSIKEVKGGGTRALGNPPSTEGKDWVILIQKQ